ncbi:MAG: cytochrome bo3 ubiquinol oxidase subunit 3 [Candidatus Westeberhardia cardiocondylae]|nr:cytochrome bo3 ubiquinol oxidase subunit 3 [Candidatus Westeberhardia cardiocondylae]
MSKNKILLTKNQNHPNTTDIKIFGFWIYLMSDCIIFATLFTIYITLVNNTNTGPTIQDICTLPHVFVETIFLLSSSITYSMALITLKYNKTKEINIWLIFTAILGISFVYIELQELYYLVKQGYGPNFSAFLSSFFTLLSTHNLHVILGIFWILIMIVQIHYQGTTLRNQILLKCLGLFWHFLDIIWIILITIVYLLQII